MKRVKIIQGSYGHRLDSGGVALITTKSPPITVNDDEAERLVELGVAAIVENDIPLTRPGESQDTEEKPEYSMKNKSDELKALMDKFGLEYEDGITKQQMVDALDAFFDASDDEEDEDEDTSQGMPNPGVQNSVVE